MTKRLILTKKAQDLIETVASGKMVGEEDIYLATVLWRISTPSFDSHRFLQEFLRGNPSSRRLEALGWLESYEDKSEYLLEKALPELKSYQAEEILPVNINVSEKGKVLMDALKKGEKLSDRELAIGNALWCYCRNENSIPPWNISKLLDEKWLVPDEDDEQLGSLSRELV